MWKRVHVLVLAVSFKEKWIVQSQVESLLGPYLKKIKN